MSIRPIEPGCLVMIIRSSLGENVGKTGHVVGHDPHCPYGYIWGVDVGYSPGLIVGRGCIVNDDPIWAQASDLLRIDDHGEDADDYEVIREEWGIMA